MLPIMEGVIRRRVLLNFRVEPDLVTPLLPAPIEVLSVNGVAIVGVCLIGMEQLRPKGLPGRIGMSSENMAHRVAIRYPTGNGMQDGVFIWRRETDDCLVSLLGGRLFPGVQQRAAFTIQETADSISIDVKTGEGQADVGFAASYGSAWATDSVFATFDDAAEFFRRGDCGFSCSLRAGKLDGLQLKTLRWDMSALRITRLHAAFFEDAHRFPAGAVQFDCALLMRGVPHEWHEIGDLPEMAGAIQG